MDRILTTFCLWNVLPPKTFVRLLLRLDVCSHLRYRRHLHFWYPFQFLGELSRFAYREPAQQSIKSPAEALLESRRKHLRLGPASKKRTRSEAYPCHLHSKQICTAQHKEGEKKNSVHSLFRFCLIARKINLDYEDHKMAPISLKDKIYTSLESAHRDLRIHLIATHYSKMEPSSIF